MEKVKRSRRNDGQILSDLIVQLYQKIGDQVTSLKEQKASVEDIFDALKPLRELEDSYRNADGMDRREDEIA